MKYNPTKIIAFSLIALMSTASLPTASFAMVNAASGTDAQVPAQQEPTVPYVTGGIGDDETAALESASKDYNLHMLNAERDGAYVDNTTVTVSDKKGNVLLTVQAGPILYAQLPAGNYTVMAEHNGAQQKKNIKLSRSTSNVNFLWN